MAGVLSGIKVLKLPRSWDRGGIKLVADVKQALVWCVSPASHFQSFRRAKTSLGGRLGVASADCCLCGVTCHTDLLQEGTVQTCDPTHRTSVALLVTKRRACWAFRRRSTTIEHKVPQQFQTTKGRSYLMAADALSGCTSITLNGNHNSRFACARYFVTTRLFFPCLVSFRLKWAHQELACHTLQGLCRHWQFCLSRRHSKFHLHVKRLSLS